MESLIGRSLVYHSICNEPVYFSAYNQNNPMPEHVKETYDLIANAVRQSAEYKKLKDSIPTDRETHGEVLQSIQFETGDLHNSIKKAKIYYEVKKVNFEMKIFTRLDDDFNFTLLGLNDYRNDVGLTTINNAAWCMEYVGVDMAPAFGGLGIAVDIIYKLSGKQSPLHIRFHPIKINVRLEP